MVDTGGVQPAGDVLFDSAGDEEIGLPDTSDDIPESDMSPDSTDSMDTLDSQEDPQEVPGSFGWPCDDGSDCLSGYCIETANGKACTSSCQEECPEDFDCVQDMSSRPDLVFVCLPRYSRLCLPCQEDKDCQPVASSMGALCLDHGPEGKFCGARCDDTPCPDGDLCQEIDTTEGPFMQCLPEEGGGCECNPLGVHLDAYTACYFENDWGQCAGVRLCEEGGLTDCDAFVPSAEKCNTQDDDCDGDTDEDLGETSCGQGICLHTVDNCVEGEAVLCDPYEGSITEACNGQDDNCDGQTDEGFEDTNDDGIADCLTDDDDADGIPDGQDNCPATPNPRQENTDFDGQGDACDPDDDNDQVPEEYPSAPSQNFRTRPENFPP
jgi:hypothetical protein